MDMNNARFYSEANSRQEECQATSHQDTTSARLHKLWEMAIRLIEIVNKLINDRLTVFLAMEGGLVAGADLHFESVQRHAN